MFAAVDDLIFQAAKEKGEMKASIAHPAAVDAFCKSSVAARTPLRTFASAAAILAIDECSV